MSQIVNVPVGNIDHNPSRLLKRYPYIESKIEALKRSMQQDGIGCWEGIIARRSGARYEIAFGHHRVKAAKEIGLKEIPLIVRQLDDKQMLQFMGRENLDDYAASFTIMLETWEAAEKFCASGRPEAKVEPVDIARLLGWVRGSSQYPTSVKMTDIASACYAAHKLIAGGHMDRETLSGLQVNAARQIVERAWSRMEQLERLASKDKRPRAEVEHAKKQVAKGAKETAREVKAGRVASRDIRGRVDVNAYRHAKDAKRVSPLFDAFGKALAESVSNMLADDSTSTKLQSVVAALGKIELDTDKKIVERLVFELAGLEKRAGKWHERMSKKPGTVTNLKVAKS